MDAILWAIAISCLVWAVLICVSELKKRKQTSEATEQLNIVKKEDIKPIVSCSNYEVDDAYDRLINEILDKGTMSKIEEHYLNFNWNGKEYAIWIANKDCGYGNSLRLVKTNKELVRGRGLRQETLNKLYEKEIAFTTVCGKPVTRKEKEDEFIKSMLEDN